MTSSKKHDVEPPNQNKGIWQRVVGRSLHEVWVSWNSFLALEYTRQITKCWNFSNMVWYIISWKWCLQMPLYKINVTRDLNTLLAPIFCASNSYLVQWLAWLWARTLQNMVGLQQFPNIQTSRVSCQKGPTCHAYAWQIGPFWQDTLDMWSSRVSGCYYAEGR